MNMAVGAAGSFWSSSIAFGVDEEVFSVQLLKISLLFISLLLSGFPRVASFLFSSREAFFENRSERSE